MEVGEPQVGEVTRLSIYFLLLLHHFEITGGPCNLIGSNWCDLFTNHTQAVCALWLRWIMVVKWKISHVSCRGRVNNSGSSKIAWITRNLMEIHCLLQFLRKLKSVCGPVRLLLFLRDKFVVRRQLKTFRKNRNCSLARESIHLAAVSHTADGCVNSIKCAS